MDATLWDSGRCKRCAGYRREISWLDVDTSELVYVHTREMLARTILGEQKFVSTGAPRAVEDLKCFQRKSRIDRLQSFKCPNRAQSMPAMLKILRHLIGA